MGSINNLFESKELSFQKLENILNYILHQENINSQKFNILSEIGLTKQYSYLIKEKSFKDCAYISQSNKTLKNYISSSKEKSNFFKWINLLFDINEDDLNSAPNLNPKIAKLRQTPLNKTFFRKNITKNLLNNESNIKILKYGFPKYLRKFIWEIIIEEKYSNNKAFNYNEIKNKYNLILNRNKNRKDTQIEKDLYRTFSDDSDKNENNLQKLKNILGCTNSLMKDGYCQGLNFIVAFLLKALDFDEIMTFYILKNILPLISGYFENGFPLLQKNKEIFLELFKELYPDLNAHFMKNDVFSEFWISRWLQTLFTLSLDFNELCPIWDLFLIKGFDFSIYISLAIVQILEKNLLKLNDSSDILLCFKNFMNPEKIYSRKSEEKNIIPLSKLIEKALHIEEKIKNNIILKKISINTKDDDCDSSFTNDTKETDTLPSSNSSSHGDYSNNSKNIIFVYNSPNKNGLNNKKKTFENIDLKNINFRNIYNNTHDKNNYSLYVAQDTEQYIYYNNVLTNNAHVYNNFMI